MDDIFLNAELLLYCCICCEIHDEPNNYSNRENLLTTGTLVTSSTNEQKLQKNQSIKRD